MFRVCVMSCFGLVPYLTAGFDFVSTLFRLCFDLVSTLFWLVSVGIDFVSTLFRFVSTHDGKHNNQPWSLNVANGGTMSDSSE